MANIKDPRAEEDTYSIDFQEEIVTILVGPKKASYRVHKSYLAKPGTFFETALKKKWTKGQDRIIELPEDSPYSFNVYVQWLYTGKVFCKPSYQKDPETQERNYPLLANLYVLGQKLLDRVFQDRIVDAVIAATHDTAEKSVLRCMPEDSTVDTVYQHTSKESPMRRLMVNIHVRHGHEEWVNLNTDPDNLNVEFLVDLTTAFYKLKDDETMMAKLEELDYNPGCEYHHHGKEEECGSYVKKTKPS